MIKLAIFFQKNLIALGHFLIALFKVLFISKWNIKLPKPTKNNLTILGNGPSLQQDLTKIEDKSTTDFMAVNYFVHHELFAQLKPNYYLLCDPLFFRLENKESLEKFYTDFWERAAWKISLFIPANEFKQFLKLKSIFKLENSNISIFQYNKTNANSSNPLIQNLYARGWLIPSPTTVLIPCLMTGINMAYNTINITGASHNYHEGIKVGNDNILMLKVPHFYKEEPIYKPYKKPDSSDTYSLSEFYLVLHKMFGAYRFVSIFAQTKRVKLYNLTADSFIDQLEKK